MKRRRFSREFKIEAVTWATKRGVAVAQAPGDLEVAKSVPRRWMREQAEAVQGACPEARRGP